jgi:TRAP-type C4-dicarboxylate transport system permease small subunit
LKIIKKIFTYTERSIVVLLGINIFLMLGLTILNIVLRQFQETLLWIEPLVRHLVFLSCFLGAALASGQNKHIKIDLLVRLLERYKETLFPKFLALVINIVTLIVLYFLIKSGTNFYSVEKDYATEAFLGFNSADLILIIPFGFSLLFIKTLLASFLIFGEEK